VIPRHRRTLLVIPLLVAVLLLGGWLRWQFIHTVRLYPDEFVTLLAIEMIGERGTPTLPSGLFYEHGLLYSYLAGVAALAGPPHLAGRYLSMALGMLAILLLFRVGRRWFSPWVGLLAALGLAVSPAAIHWSGRVRMYALLQLLVLLTLWLLYSGIMDQRPTVRRLGLVAYLGATLAHFGAVALAPPLVAGTLLLVAVQARPASWRDFLSRLRSYWLDGLALGLILLLAFVIKRAGQPKGLAPLAGDATAALGGIGQVFVLYSDFSFNAVAGWLAISPFFVAPAALLFTIFALIAAGLATWRGWRCWRTATEDNPEQWLPALFSSVILLLTSLEIILLVSPDRRDDKYLFMLLPLLLLLGAAGLAECGRWLRRRLSERVSNNAGPYLPPVATLLTMLLVVTLSWPDVQALLSNRGDDYERAFAYVQEQWQAGDTVLTGTPAAAMFYLGRNDFYSVQRRGGYDYRLLSHNDQAVDRWLGSPAIRTEAALHNTLANHNVWLVLERWGLQREYYDLPFQQQLLAQTEPLFETQGIFVLRSLPNPRPVQPDPAVTVNANFANQISLLGYTVEPTRGIPGQPLRLTLYWQALTGVPHDYTVFVHLRRPQGGNVAQADHRPLGNLYPTSLWPPHETIRETSNLPLPADLAPGPYELWIGLYLLDTGERLAVQDDKSGENAVKLGIIEIRD
jgi:hypothetical protein